MAATTSGALKAWLEAPSPGNPYHTGMAFYRDRAPRDSEGALAVTLPFGVITEAIAVTPVPMGDLGDQDADRQVLELAQVSIYEVWRDVEGKPAEQYDLPTKVWRRLEGARLVDGPKPATVKVTGRRRLPAIDGTSQNVGLLSAVGGVDGANVVANHFTVTIARDA